MVFSSELAAAVCGSSPRRGSAYSVAKIVNIVNPEGAAYDFKVVDVFKYQYVKNKESCLKLIPKNLEISHNFQRKILRESDDYKKNSTGLNEIKEKELEEKLALETKRVDEIIKNPDDFNIIISGYLDKVQYEQINYGIKKIIDDKDTTINRSIRDKAKHDGFVKKRFNKHLSITKPNIIVYEPDEDVEKERVLMEVKYLEKRGYELVARGIFCKKTKARQKK